VFLNFGVGSLCGRVRVGSVRVGIEKPTRPDPTRLETGQVGSGRVGSVFRVGFFVLVGLGRPLAPPALRGVLSGKFLSLSAAGGSGPLDRSGEFSLHLNAQKRMILFRHSTQTSHSLF